jgi:formate hydrogenlyase transcriptional activator
MTTSSRGSVAIESSAQLILDVAKAASAHLDMSEVLKALTQKLNAHIHFDAIAVFVVDEQFVRLHALYVDGWENGAPRTVVARNSAESKVEPPRERIPIHQHHASAILRTLRPYVCSDVERNSLFEGDQKLLQYGIGSYVTLPLLNRGSLTGIVDFFSTEKRSYSEEEVQLLQDVSDIVSIAVSNALAYAEIHSLKEQLQAENRLLQDEIVQRAIYEEIVGSSEALRHTLSAIERVAGTDSTVLITGETGTGKELVAHAIHRRSQRSGRALVKVNCAALPAELIASELFGHEKGAFTGALQQRLGRFEAANSGTIFLDEVGELPQEMQIALLRVLQEKEFERVGGNRSIRTDVRVIAATNRELEREVAEGRFRTDLYYRLNVFPIRVPSLRERPDDIPILVDYFVTRLANRMGKHIRQIDRRSLDTMQQYSWPGNIRELQNVIERGVILSDTDVFRLPAGAIARTVRMESQTRSRPGAHVSSIGQTTDTRADERAHIESILKETRGRISGPDGAAARLGIPASTLESRIRSLKINKHQYRGEAE